MAKTEVQRWTHESYSATRVLVFDQDTLKAIVDTETTGTDDVTERDELLRDCVRSPGRGRISVF